jgi:hypothetical protein
MNVAIVGPIFVSIFNPFVDGQNVLVEFVNGLMAIPRYSL